MANKIDLAEQQLLGFKHRESGHSLIELVESMGLTEKEWGIIKADYTTSYLTDSDEIEIDDYFKELNNE